MALTQKERSKRWREKHPDKSRSDVASRRLQMRLKCIAYKGGECILCGYYRCRGALEFHHRDPATKLFELNYGNMGRSWESLQPELDKCILVCANCHREIHEQK